MSQKDQGNSKKKYYFQKGGAIRFPYRYFNEGATPFQPCECKSCPLTGVQCGGGKYNQQGGSINFPYRYFNANATPFQPCGAGCGGQVGGCLGCGLVPRSDPMGVYYNDFRRYQGMHDYNSDNMSSGAAPYNQSGGNPIEAPLHIFTAGAPLTYNYSMKENFTGSPTFDRVGYNHFW